MTLTVSDDQAIAIMHGTPLKEEPRFIELEQGAGPRPIPEWALDAHIDWMEKWSNSPKCLLKIAYDPLRQQELAPIWRRLDSPRGAWIGRNEGMASLHYHSGAITRNADGELQTTQQEGYAGRTFKIRMAEDQPFYPGEVVNLRGPWHGGAPAGYIEVYCLVYDDKERERHLHGMRWKDRMVHLGPDRKRWWRQTLSFGWYVEERVFLDIMATFLPHIRFAQVLTSIGWRVQPLMLETGLPKGWK